MEDFYNAEYMDLKTTIAAHINDMYINYFLLGKVLIIGGGIANFTNVAATFKVL